MHLKCCCECTEGFPDCVEGYTGLVVGLFLVYNARFFFFRLSFRHPGKVTPKLQRSFDKDNVVAGQVTLIATYHVSLVVRYVSVCQYRVYR